NSSAPLAMASASLAASTSPTQTAFARRIRMDQRNRGLGFCSRTKYVPTAFLPTVEIAAKCLILRWYSWADSTDPRSEISSFHDPHQSSQPAKIEKKRRFFLECC